MLGATSGCISSESRFSSDIALLREAADSPDGLADKDWLQPAEGSLLWTRAWPAGVHGSVRRATKPLFLPKTNLRNGPGAFLWLKSKYKAYESETMWRGSFTAIDFISLKAPLQGSVALSSDHKSLVKSHTPCTLDDSHLLPCVARATKGTWPPGGLNLMFVKWSGCY